MGKQRFKWDDEKIQYLIANWNKKALYKLAAELRTIDETLLEKAKELGLPEYKSNRWTEKEVAKLKELAPRLFYKEIATVLGKSELAILKKANKLGIKIIYVNDANSAAYWTGEKEKYLLENYGKIGITDLGNEIDVPYNQILKKLKEHGIEWETRTWKEEEIKILKKMAPTCHYTEIAKVLDRSVGAIGAKAFDLAIETISDYRKFTDEEKLYTIENWNDISGADIARTLKCSLGQLYGLQRKSNLPKKGQTIKWTDKKISYLRKLAKTKTISELAKRFKTTNSAITAVASKNKIELINSKDNWSEKQKQQLKELSKTMTVDQIVKIIRKPSHSVRNQANKLDIELIKNSSVHSTKSWTKEEIKQLKDLITKYDTIEISEMMDRTEDSVYVKAKKLGLVVLGANRRWTIEDEETLQNMWGEYSISYIAKKLNRTSSAITNRAHILKLGSAMANYSEGLTIQEICDLFAVDRNTIGVTWVSLGLVFTKKRISASRTYSIVTVNELYSFLEQYQNIWDSRMLEKNILPPEPDWLIEKRKRDSLLPILIPKNETVTKEQLIAARKYYLDLVENQEKEGMIFEETSTEIANQKVLK